MSSGIEDDLLKNIENELKRRYGEHNLNELYKKLKGENDEK